MYWRQLSSYTFFSTHESLTLKKFEVLPCHIILIEESYDDIAKQMHTIHI